MIQPVLLRPFGGLTIGFAGVCGYLRGLPRGLLTAPPAAGASPVVVVVVVPLPSGAIGSTFGSIVVSSSSISSAFGITSSEGEGGELTLANLTLKLKVVAEFGDSLLDAEIEGGEELRLIRRTPGVSGGSGPKTTAAAIRNCPSLTAGSVTATGSRAWRPAVEILVDVVMEVGGTGACELSEGGCFEVLFPIGPPSCGCEWGGILVVCYCCE